MKRYIAPLISIFLTSVSLLADDKATLKLDSVRTRIYSDTTIIVIGITNDSATSLRAFRATLSGLNDFNEAKQLCSIEFSSKEVVETSRGRTSGHVVQPGEMIFYVLIAKDNGRNEQGFTLRPPDRAKFAQADGRFQLQVAKIVSVDGSDAPARPAARPSPLSPMPNAPQESNADSPPPKPVPTRSDSVPLASNTPAAEPQYYTVIGVAPGDFLNVRSGPAMNTSVAFKLTNGDKVQVTGQSSFNGDTEWIPIAVDSKQGWVRNKYLRPQSK